MTRLLAFWRRAARGMVCALLVAASAARAQTPPLTIADAMASAVRHHPGVGDVIVRRATDEIRHGTQVPQ